MLEGLPPPPHCHRERGVNAMEALPAPAAARLRPGTPIVVRNSLNLWSSGFEVEGWRDGACRVRRNSDGAVLPRSFSTDDVRPADRSRPAITTTTDEPRST